MNVDFSTTCVTIINIATFEYGAIPIVLKDQWIWCFYFNLDELNVITEMKDKG